MKLVVVADDFGFCKSVNIGIVESHKKGIVTELSLMLGSPATDQALGMVKEQGITNVGIHMLLKNWRDTGALVRRADYIKLFDELSEADIAKLVEAELQEFEQVVGHKPSHITSQFGIAVHIKAISAVIDYALKHNIPMRQPVMTLYGDEPEQNEQSLALMQKRGVRTTDHFIARIMEPDYDKLISLYQQDLLVLKANETAELALHPGLAGDDLRAMSSLVDERARDLKLTTDTAFRSWVESHDIKIVGYGDIRAS